MSLNYYLKKNPLMHGKKYFAQTIHSRIMDDEKLLAYMALKSSALSASELKGVLDLLKESINELLIQGCRIVLNDMISLYPSIKASFDKVNESFNHGNNSIKVSCRVSRSLHASVSKNISVEKNGKGELAPTLENVISGKAEKNIIRWPYSTTIIGENLNPKNVEIQGIRILNQHNTSEKIDITGEDIIIDSQSDKQVTFSINHEIDIPSWLVAELPVYLQLVYPGRSINMDVTSYEVETYWLREPELPVEQENQSDLEETA